MIKNKNLRIYVIGLIILFGAILINYISTFVGLSSWYGLLSGNKTVISTIDWIYLLIIYPFLLGFIGYYSFNLSEKNKK